MASTFICTESLVAVDTISTLDSPINIKWYKILPYL
jgi:hypothetical protein